MLADYLTFKLLFSDDYGWLLKLFFVGLWSIIIPSSYILKTEKVRRDIINNRWVNPLRNTFRGLDASVAPAVKLEMDARAQPSNNIGRQPIPTISAGVRMAEN